MKKFIIALTALFALTVQANAMSYEQAREQALFLADKMAYELNLTEDQYEAAYEINLDYLMSINNYDDLYGVYWERRNMDLSYILLDWQYRAYCAASYFYRPLYWDAGYWHFGIYARYPHRSYFYFGRPHFYLTYRGGHAWHVNHGRSWYHGRNWGMAHRNHHNGRGFGMRNGFDRGDYRNHGSRGMERGNINRGNNRGLERGNRGFGNNGSRSIEQRGTRSLEHRSNPGTINRNGNFGGSRSSSGVRESSTRSTVGGNSQRGFSMNRERSNFSTEKSTPSRTFTPSRSSSDRGSSSFGSSSRSRGSYSTPSRSSGSSSRGSFSTPSRSSGGSFSGSHSGGGSRGGMSRGGGSHGGGSRGGSFGGHR